MNRSSNPWSFVPADVNTATLTSLVLQSDGSVNLTLAAAFSQLDLNVNSHVTIYNTGNPKYNGLYVVRTKTSSTVYNIVKTSGAAIPPGTASSGGGIAAQPQYHHQVRIEDMSWQNEAAAGNQLIMADRNGNIIWQATASSANFQNRGKVFWVEGIVIIQMDSGIVLVTVN